jgi:hypothetical protein
MAGPSNAGRGQRKKGSEKVFLVFIIGVNPQA